MVGPSANEEDIITCKVCGEIFIRKNNQEHKNSEVHFKAAQEKDGWVTCVQCKTNYVKGYWTQHQETEVHQDALNQKCEEKKNHENDKIVCKICKKKYVKKDFEEHKKTEIHRQAQKEMFGYCDICKERFVKEYWNHHTKMEIHKLFERKLKNKGKMTMKHRDKREHYQFRQWSEENQQYIDSLTTFLMLRYVFKSDNLCKFSINNDEWKQFGDIVVEICTSTDTEIEVIRCKKVQSKSNFSDLLLSAESGKFSIKEQYEILQPLKTKTNYSKASFNLHTVSNILLDEKTIESWKDPEKNLWKGRKVEVKQQTGYKKNDMLNTTDDWEDVFNIKVEESDKGESHDNDIEFWIYKNQKQLTDLKTAIHSIILEEKFHCGEDISDQLIKYVHSFFNPEKMKKFTFKAAKDGKEAKKPYNFKMTTEDVFYKLAEFLLIPYFVLPDSMNEEKSELWNKTIEHFDFVVVKNSPDIIKKLYSPINKILKTETDYTLTYTSEVQVEKAQVKNPVLASSIFEHSGFDRSLRFMYLSLWKTGLTPLILSVQHEDELQSILRVISFLKTKNILLKFIIISNLNLDHSYFPDNLNGFLNGEDLRLLDYENFRQILNETRISFLNFNVSLAEIVRCNRDFLEMLTPDDLLNMFIGDYSFKDIQAPLTKEIMDYTLAFEEETLRKSRQYFLQSADVNLEQSNNLSYLTNNNGKPVWIQVPPDI